MKEFLNVIKNSQLFAGIEAQEIEAMLTCLSAVRREYAKDEFLLREGERVNFVGFVLSGSVCVIQEDFWGNRNIIAKVFPGETYAQSYACVPGASLGVSVLAAEASVVMMLDVRRILTVCSSACTFHARLIRNLLSDLAEKNLRMNEKLTHITQRSTRDKLLSYLSAESRRIGDTAFTIPFNRQQLADYLSVERSAMSSELCKLRNEGVLEFKKNHFILK